MRNHNEADDPVEEPPPEYETRPEPSELTPFAQRQELLGRFLDCAEILDSGLAIAAAARARSIDELREVSEAIAHEEQAEDASKPPQLRANAQHESGWSVRNRARAELTTEIAVAFMVSKSAARLLIEESATLVADLPLTLDALESGSIRYEHARLMTSTVWSLPQEARAAFEEEALPWAKTMILSAFRTKLLSLREKHHPESMRERHEKAAAFRTVTLEPGEDGVGFLTLRDANETLSAIYNRITDIALPKAKDDPRTLAQRRVDAATEILLHGDLCTSDDGPTGDEGADAAATKGKGTTKAKAKGEGKSKSKGGKPLGHGITAQVHVTIPVLTLLGQDDEPATLDGTIPIDPVTARTLVARAPGFYRVLTDPITGSIVSFDDTYRYLPKSLRRAVQLIDATCTGPWCTAPATETDGHHPEEWAKTHTTSLENSALLCPIDHKLIHNTRWSMTKEPGGDKKWISPSGRVHRVPPRYRLSPAFVEALKPQPHRTPENATPTGDGWPTIGNPDDPLPF